MCVCVCVCVCVSAYAIALLVHRRRRSHFRAEDQTDCGGFGRYAYGRGPPDEGLSSRMHVLVTRALAHIGLPGQGHLFLSLQFKSCLENEMHFVFTTPFQPFCI